MSFQIPATNPTSSSGGGDQLVPMDPSPEHLPPIQSSDDQGKTLPKYRMGIGQRILGTLANFANGFARTGAQPTYVGPGALNKRYYQDQADREQQNQYIAQHNNEAYWNYVDPG